MKCDFCSEPARTLAGWWSHGAPDFPMPEILPGVTPGMSSGSWLACPECQALLATEAWPALTARSVDAYYVRNPETAGLPRALLFSWIDRLHQEFRMRRTGTVSPADAPEKGEATS
jgi:hypothetical protein